MHKWYQVLAALGERDTPEIWVYGDIGSNWDEETIVAKDFVAELESIKAPEIVIRFGSIGGSVQDGLLMFNAISRHPAKITAIIDGGALSIASMIPLAADVVQMADNVPYMIHAPWGAAVGNAKALRDRANDLDRWASYMAQSYSKRASVDAKYIESLLADGENHFFSAAEAKEKGFVDEILEGIEVAASAEISRELLGRYTHSLTQSASTKVKTQLEMNMDKKAKAKALGITLEEYLALEAKAQAKDMSPEDYFKQWGLEDAPDDNAQAKGGDKGKQQQNSQPQASQQQKTETTQASQKGLTHEEFAQLESKRRTDIRAIFKPFAGNHQVDLVLSECLDDLTITASQAQTKALAALGASSQQSAAGGHVRTLDSGRDDFLQDAVACLLVKAGFGDKDDRLRVQKSSMRNFRTFDFARACLEIGGVNASGLDQMGLVAKAFTTSTSDFPLLLENTMHKTLQAAYAAAEFTWRRFCFQGSVSDFRDHNRYRLGSLSNLEALTELNEFKNKEIPDGEKARVSIGTKGNIINISRQAIINDDLGAFIGLANWMGRAAARTVEADVYAALLSNGGNGPLLEDGLALFDAAHNNTNTGALSVASIDADRVIMGSQQDVSGNDFLDLRPEVLLIALGLGGQARVLNETRYDPDSTDASQKPNMVVGLYNDVVDSPRLSGTARYSFANPNIAPVLEVDFLDGNDTPFLEQMAGFTVDGTMYKVRLDFGVSAVDYRGVVKNSGA